MGCTALTEPGTGSDLASIQTTATLESNVWLLKGRKALIINATQADIIILYAQPNPGTRTSGIATLLIDSSFNIIDNIQLNWSNKSHNEQLNRKLNVA